MNKIKYLLVFAVLFSIGLAFAQNAAVNFKDAAGAPLTKTAIDPEAMLVYGQAYTATFPVLADRWRFQWYKTTDNVIDPLDANGNPTGDDVIAVGNVSPGNTTGVVTLAPTLVWAPSAAVFAPPGGNGNTWIGDKVYLRIFNHNQIAMSTKAITFHTIYTITPDLTQVIQPYIPGYGWGPWTPHVVVVENPPNPAVYVAPPNMATGLGYAGQILSWNPAVTGGLAEGYKVYFGVDNPPMTMVSDQVSTTYATGALMQNVTYYWQVVPYNADGDAEGNAVWSFTTRSELNPNCAENPVPANGAMFASPVPGGFVQTLSWSAPSTGVTPSGYKLAYMGVPPIDIGNVLTTDVLINGPGVITWQIIPYYIDGGMRKVEMKPIEATLGSGRLANVRGDAVGCPEWTFTVTPYVAPTYAVNVTSVPVAPIYVNGAPSGFNTPHVFQMEQGTSAVYSVVLPGYTWVPAEYAVNNIMGAVDINFVGTIMTYPVLIESSPVAPIYVNGVASGFDTPHTFFMDYGTSATYSVQLPQYTWVPENFVVSNIMAPASVNFLGTYVPGMFQFSVTSVPAGAAIYVDGMNSGFVTPHVFNMVEGASALYSVQMAGYTWMPVDYQVTNILANGSVNFVGTLNTYTVDVTSVPAGAAIYVGGVDSGFVTPHQFVLPYGANAVYSVMMAGYTWMPADYTITNIMANDAVNFVGTILTYTVDITSAPAGAAIWVDGMDSGYVTPYQFVMNYGTSATYYVTMMGYIWTPAQYVVTNIMANAAQHFVGASFDGMIEPGVPEYMEPPAGVGIPGVTVLSPETTPFNIDYFIYTVGDMPMSSPNPLLDDTNTYGAVLSHSGGTVDLTVFVPAGMWYVAGYWGGMWHTADPYPYMGTVPGYVVLYGIEFGAKGDVPIWFSQLNPTVPVELQSFNAVVTAANFVSLTWVTATETGVLGFNVYRSDNGNAADAYKVNNQIIAATNTSQTATYNLIDSENLSVGNTYYYWLQAVDMNGFTTMNGPVNVTINGTVVPPMPELSTMSNAYPNPFRVGQSTTISVDIKAGETGTVTVYNLLGQTVKTFKVNEGQHNLSWNANGCASGIYFYKLSTPTVNSTKKLVIVN